MPIHSYITCLVVHSYPVFGSLQGPQIWIIDIETGELTPVIPSGVRGLPASASEAGGPHVHAGGSGHGGSGDGDQDLPSSILQADGHGGGVGGSSAELVPVKYIKGIQMSHHHLVAASDDMVGYTHMTHAYHAHTKAGYSACALPAV